jgi:hypothetical protein
VKHFLIKYNLSGTFMKTFLDIHEFQNALAKLVGSFWCLHLPHVKHFLITYNLSGNFMKIFLDIHEFYNTLAKMVESF